VLRCRAQACCAAEQLEVGAKVELHSLNATEHNGKRGELLEYDAEAQRWAVELYCSVKAAASGFVKAAESGCAHRTAILPGGSPPLPPPSPPPLPALEAE